MQAWKCSGYGTDTADTLDVGITVVESHDGAIVTSMCRYQSTVGDSIPLPPPSG